MFSMMFRRVLLVMAAVSAFALARLAPAADDTDAYPKPSPVPVSWELKFTHSDPKRIIVELPGDPVPHAFWYLTYSVTNQNELGQPPAQERIFFPQFTIRTEDGKLLKGNDSIHPAVFQAIKAAEKNKYLEEPTLMGGKILVGDDQKRESVAIWPETTQRTGAFTIFVSGLWGETAPAKDSQGNPLNDASGNPLLLHKTLMLQYHVDGDETHFGRVRKVSEDFIMR